jgi:hypothetical protein
VKFGLVEHDETLRIPERKRREKDPVHNREERDICPDPERHDDDCNSGEAGRAPQRAKGEVDIA